ncbi:MAG TPA: hypothetical protein VML19_14075 [Verrucomicrobiae bacterium]|nr:hypothetical protein [Verrucomicrobiae bacterium]
MRGALALSILAAMAAPAQTILPQDRAAMFFGRPDLGELVCRATGRHPTLDFSFRFRAGYLLSVPMKQYRGPGHHWYVVVQVYPVSGGPAVAFADRFDLPPVPPTDLIAETGGAFMLGQGDYHAKFLLVDDLNRGCRAEWNIRAQPSLGEGNAKLAIPAGTIEEAGPRSARSASAPALPSIGRMTIFLNAAGSTPDQVHADDAITLIGALSSLLDLAPARAVRLVVFNLDKRQEIYRRENFGPDQIDEVRQAMLNLQLGTVDVKTLQNPAGGAGMLADLVTQELHAQDPSDAVVFLGSRAWSKDKAAAIPKPGPGAPGFFYVEYMRRSFPPSSVGVGPSPSPGGLGIPAGMGRRAGTVLPSEPNARGDWSDSIHNLMDKIGGKTLVVTSPGDFASAMRRVARRNK